MDRELRAKIHEINRTKIGVTLNIIARGYYEVDGERVNLEKDTVAQCIEFSNIDDHEENRINTPVCKLIDNDTLGAAIAEMSDKHPLVLNFANPYKPGGGVYRGSNAQEEDLCRRSTLLPALESEEASDYYIQNCYEHETDPAVDSFERAVLVKNVKVFVDSSGDLMKKPIKVDVLTIASPYLCPDDESNGYAERHCPSIEDIVQATCSIVNAYNYEYAVFGAIGCGAFHQDPDNVARKFKECLEAKSSLKEVIFAVPTWNGAETENFAAFAMYF